MNDLLVIAFSSEEKAENVRQKLISMQKEFFSNLATPLLLLKRRMDPLSSISFLTRRRLAVFPVLSGAR
jgi:uncharacterized membrane protein